MVHLVTILLRLATSTTFRPLLPEHLQQVKQVYRAHTVLAVTEQEASARPLLLKDFFRAGHLSYQSLVDIRLSQLVLDLVLVKGVRDLLLNQWLLGFLALLLLVGTARHLLVDRV